MQRLFAIIISVVCVIVQIFLYPCKAESGWSSTTAPYSLNSISGTTSEDVFAVGAYGVILHYDGNNWTQMNSGTSLALNDVWCNASNDVFAVGTVGSIFHYNGSVWSQMTTNVQNRLDGVWGSSAQDVFAVGDNGIILHYNGESWSNMPSNFSGSLNGIWGNSATDVYVVGNYYSGIPPDGVVLHYNGTDWSVCYRPSAKPLMNIWGTSPNDIWAVGTAGAIVHYNGTSWSVMNSGTNKHLSGVWGNSGTNVFTVGSQLFSGNGIVRHYDGSLWNEVVADVNNEFYGVWGMGESEVFVVGGISNSTGIILHYEEETVITLSSFKAIPLNKKVILQWSTESEIDNAGFNIYRSETENGQYNTINDSLIPAEGSTIQGASYEYIDSGLRNGKTYYYKLEDIDTNGISTFHGPVSATPRWIYGISKHKISSTHFLTEQNKTG